MNDKSKDDVLYEDCVTKVLNKDGIAEVSLGTENQFHYAYRDYVEEMGEGPWAQRIVYNESVSGVLIHQHPGKGNRTHYHETHDEWWVVLKGRIKWWIEGHGTLIASPGDIVFAPRMRMHKIRTVGEEPSIRLAISPPDIPHCHPTEDLAPEDF